MTNQSRGFRAWVRRIFSPGSKSPSYYIVEFKEGVPVPDRGDDEAIASLRDHPGMTAILNRLRLKRAILESELKNARHSSLRDVDILQLGIFWNRFTESELNISTGRVSTRKMPTLAVDEVAEFEKVRAAIESIRATSPE